MTVEQFIKELEKFDKDAEISAITAVGELEWKRTDCPKITQHKNMLGKWVFIG